MVTDFLPAVLLCLFPFAIGFLAIFTTKPPNWSLSLLYGFACMLPVTGSALLWQFGIPWVAIKTGNLGLTSLSQFLTNEIGKDITIIVLTFVPFFIIRRFVHNNLKKTKYMKEINIQSISSK